MERKEVNILDYLFIVYQARWYIILQFVIVCVLAGALSYLLPVYYQSTATLLPPNDSDDSFGFSSAMRMLPVNISLGATGTPSDVFIGIMKSERVRRIMVERFGLMEEYGSSTMDSAILTLEGLSDFMISRNGLITIKVQDRDPDRAAEMANFYWSCLDSLNQLMGIETSQERAQFMSDQLVENEAALARAEAELTAFQEEHGILSPVHQQRVVLSVTAELEAEILQLEGLIDEYRAKSLSDNHPLVKELTQSVTIRRNQLNELRHGAADGQDASLFVPLDGVSDLVYEYTRLSRRTEILGQLQQILVQQYEEAVIQSQNTTPTVDVLDYGFAPERKFRPKRSLIVIVAGTMSLFFSILAVVIIEFINNLTQLTPQSREKVQRLARFLRIQTS